MNYDPCVSTPASRSRRIRATIPEQPPHTQDLNVPGGRSVGAIPERVPVLSPEVTMSQKYVPWTPQAEMLSLARFARGAALRRTILSMQHIDFHVHTLRDDARNALQAVFQDAPFSETLRYPDEFWVECSDSTIGILIERMMSALSFGGSGSTEGGVGRDAYSDSKVQFAKASQEVSRRLNSKSVAVSAVDGVYFNQAAFEQQVGLTWQ